MDALAPGPPIGCRLCSGIPRWCTEYEASVHVAFAHMDTACGRQAESEFFFFKVLGVDGLVFSVPV